MILNLEIITAILGFVGAFFAKEVWDHIKGKQTKEKEVLDKVIEKNTDAIAGLSIAIMELKLRIDHLSDKLAPVPKMSADINEAHNKIRDVTTRLELLQDGK